MSLPEAVRAGVETLLEERTGRARGIRSADPVGGGCINPSARVRVEGGESFFLKWNPSSDPSMFEAEADGLQALRAGAAGGGSGTRPLLRIPAVLGWGGSGRTSDPGWLLLEDVPAGSPGPRYGEILGEGLALLHGSGSSGADQRERATGDLGAARSAGASGYGWHRDNFIGSLPQANGPEGSWSAFWRERRLEPQIRRARDNGYLGGGEGAVLDRVLDGLDGIMEGSDALGPALLHGDLWSGNYYAGPQGEPVLIDPATYRGSGEVDLAMMELFGSFPRGFLDSYGALRPLDDAYHGFRRDLYQLYYLLVHVNLFGSGYVSGTLAAARRVLRGG